MTRTGEGRGRPRLLPHIQSPRTPRNVARATRDRATEPARSTKRDPEQPPDPGRSPEPRQFAPRPPFGLGSHDRPVPIARKLYGPEILALGARYFHLMLRNASQRLPDPCPAGPVVPHQLGGCRTAGIPPSSDSEDPTRRRPNCRPLHVSSARGRLDCPLRRLAAPSIANWRRTTQGRVQTSPGIGQSKSATSCLHM